MKNTSTLQKEAKRVQKEFLKLGQFWSIPSIIESLQIKESLSTPVNKVLISTQK